ncbi:MAG: hypothetical protein HQM10_14515 [Candidatus Riflebacteria bacterium]|nr:hypothetical protein [Candidatus Riflebacteria bacterium]
MKKSIITLGLLASLLLNGPSLIAEENTTSASVTASAITSASAPAAVAANLSASSSIPLTNALTALSSAASESRYMFLLVRDKQDDTTSALKKVIETTLQKLSDKATSYEVDRNLPSEKEIIEQYDLNRAPMPLVLVVAPNGAITSGLTGDKATPEKLEAAIVSQGMTRLIKAMQDRKLVFLCVQNSNTKSNEAAMKGVNDFKADPKFGKAVEIILLDPADTKEEKLFSQLKIDTKSTEAVTTFIAPPGSKLGTFIGETNREKIEAALMAAMSGGCGSGCAPSGCGN